MCFYVCAVIRPFAWLFCVYGHNSQMQTKVKQRAFDGEITCLLRKICLFKPLVVFSLLARQSFCGRASPGSIDAQCAMQKKAQDATVVSVRAVLITTPLCLKIDQSGHWEHHFPFNLHSGQIAWEMNCAHVELICFNTRKRSKTRPLLMKEQSVLLFLIQLLFSLSP